MATGKPVVLVLENGRPLDIRWAIGACAGDSGSVVSGNRRRQRSRRCAVWRCESGGKLPVSWPRSAGQEPLYYNHNLTHEPEDRPRFTSRYWDLSSKPLYPFGYGLSYTTFKFDHLKLSRKSMKADEATEVSVEVTNAGSVAGDAVAEVYIHQRAGRLQGRCGS